jgi:hypothetical protein
MLLCKRLHHLAFLPEDGGKKKNNYGTMLERCREHESINSYFREGDQEEA